MTAVRSERYITTRRSILAAVAGGGLGALVAACTAGSRTAADSGAGEVGGNSGTVTRGAERIVLPGAPGRIGAGTGADVRTLAGPNAMKVV